MTGLFPLRPLQQGAMDGLRRSLISGKRRPVIQAPTGFGKTILSAHIVSGALVKRKRVAFVVPRLPLIDQSFERFVANGIEPASMGVMQGDHPWRRPHAPIQICSIQTLAARGFPEVDSVVVDECHLRFGSIDRWMADEPSKIFVGLSATPWSRGMGDHWDDLIIPTTIRELIDLGWLSKFRVFAPSHPDLSGVKTVAGDFHEGQLSAVMSDKKLIADVVANWLEHGENRPTLVFAVDRAHAAVIHDGFESMGVASAYVDGNTPRDERTEMLGRLRAGEINVIVSVETMTTGVDEDFRCIVLATSTKSEIKLVQSVGRGLRTAKGKTDCLIFDHGDTTLRLGMVTDIHHDKLRTAKGDEAEKKKKEAKESSEPAKPRECPACHCLVPAGVRECPGCGLKSHRPSTVIVEDGELAEIGAVKKPKREKFAEPDFYGQLQSYGKERGYAAGWASNKFKERYGVWPNGPHVKDAPPIPCGPEVRSWIRSRQIAFAHSKQNFRKAA